MNVHISSARTERSVHFQWVLRKMEESGIRKEPGWQLKGKIQEGNPKKSPAASDDAAGRKLRLALNPA